MMGMGLVTLVCESDGCMEVGLRVVQGGLDKHTCGLLLDVGKMNFVDRTEMMRFGRRDRFFEKGKLTIIIPYSNSTTINPARKHCHAFQVKVQPVDQNATPYLCRTILPWYVCVCCSP
jgi:hypothetical protein